MNDLWLWIGLALAEIFLVFFVLLLIAWIRNQAQRSRDQKAVAALLAKVKKQKPQRETTINSFLSNNFGLADIALNEQTAQIMRKELEVIGRFAKTYRDRDAVSASQFVLEVEALADPYFLLNGSPADPDAEQSEIDENELKALRRENKRLSEELSVTMETMSRMISEYSVMFANDEDAENPDGAEPPAAAVAPDGDAVASEDAEAKVPEATEEEEGVNPGADPASVDANEVDANESEPELEADASAEELSEALDEVQDPEQVSDAEVEIDADAEVVAGVDVEPNRDVDVIDADALLEEVQGAEVNEAEESEPLLSGAEGGTSASDQVQGEVLETAQTAEVTEPVDPLDELFDLDEVAALDGELAGLDEEAEKSKAS